jgi:dolichol-phosphate mannosyltransferase
MKEEPVTKSLFVVVPTYCEKENLAPLIGRILASVPEVHILVVDDNSPDGTGRLADELASSDDRITVLHRQAKAGLGQAYIAGFGAALASGADYIVEMDADGSHQPEQLPSLIAALEEGADLVIGTRWMPGGEVRNWPLHRRVISRAGTVFARVMLRSRLRDITSGYRGFRREALESIELATINSAGYCFQIELAWLVERVGRNVVEVPITFIERTIGRSKMTLTIVLEAFWMVTVWGIRGRPHETGEPVGHGR